MSTLVFVSILVLLQKGPSIFVLFICFYWYFGYLLLSRMVLSHVVRLLLLTWNGLKLFAALYKLFDYCCLLKMIL